MKEVKFRKFCLSSGNTVLCGKSAEQNELVVAQSAKDEAVLHTKEPGSPFCNIKGKAAKSDLEETALICAAFSKDWKNGRKDVEVHVFKGRDIFKEADMKTGTFGVRKAKSIKAKKDKIQKFIESGISK
jgi:predicted ribosome quality control (RQC) complex YloA/Tae2 family protein